MHRIFRSRLRSKDVGGDLPWQGILEHSVDSARVSETLYQRSSFLFFEVKIYSLPWSEPFLLSANRLLPSYFGVIYGIPRFLSRVPLFVDHSRKQVESSTKMHKTSNSSLASFFVSRVTEHLCCYCCELAYVAGNRGAPWNSRHTRGGGSHACYCYIGTMEVTLDARRRVTVVVQLRVCSLGTVFVAWRLGSSI